MRPMTLLTRTATKKIDADKNDDEEDAEKEWEDAEYDLESQKGAEDEQEAEFEEAAEEAQTQDQHAGLWSPEGATPTKSDPPTRDPESAKRIRVMLDTPYEPESVQHLIGDREEQAAVVALVRVAVKAASKKFKKLRTKLQLQHGSSWSKMAKAAKKRLNECHYLEVSQAKLHRSAIFQSAREARMKKQEMRESGEARAKEGTECSGAKDFAEGEEDFDVEGEVEGASRQEQDEGDEDEDPLRPISGKEE
eukprot:gene32798-41779_t